MIERTAADTTVAPLDGHLPRHCRKDVDTLRRFVHETVSGEAPAAAVSPSDFREVFLTGATGFIGRFFLRDLLRQNPRAPGALHRPGQERRSRFRAHTRRPRSGAGIWDESFAPRIGVLAGDVAETRFGLKEADFDALCGRIDAAYHLAASIDLVSSYLAIRKVNTFSLRNLLELCLRKRFKHLFYASTMGVFPQYFCSFAHEFKNSRIDHQMQPDLQSMKRNVPAWHARLPLEQADIRAGPPVRATGRYAAGDFSGCRRPVMSSAGYTPEHDLSVRLFAAVVDCRNPAGRIHVSIQQRSGRYAE